MNTLFLLIASILSKILTSPQEPELAIQLTSKADCMEILYRISESTQRTKQCIERVERMNKQATEILARN